MSPKPKKSKVKVNSTKMLCLECDKKFNKRLTASTYEVKCPQCGSYDTELRTASFY